MIDFSIDDLKQSIARQSFYHFVEQTWPRYLPNRFHKVLCAKLQGFYERIKAGDNPKMMITCPPRHGKSWIASQRFPLWVLGQNPHWEVMMASYTAKLATVHSGRARDLVTLDKKRGEYGDGAKIFPHLRLDERKTALDFWMTTEGGSFTALGLQGSATGKGAHLLVIDDPLRGFEEARSETIRDKIFETYSSDLLTRLAPECGQLLILTRWHEDDLAGRLLEHEPGEWEHVNFPAIAEVDEYHNGELFRREGEALQPERYPVERLNKLKDNPIYARTWSALYQQRPAPAEGGIIKRDWLKYYDEAPQGAPVLASWDLTFTDKTTSDYVAGLFFWKQDGKLYLIPDGINKQMGFVDTLAAMRVMDTMYKPYKTIIENKANGPAVVDALRLKIGSIETYNPGRNDKTARLENCARAIYDGDILFPRFSSVGDKLIAEMLTFPHAAHDDLVDALTQAILTEVGGSRLVSLYAAL